MKTLKDNFYIRGIDYWEHFNLPEFKDIMSTPPHDGNKQLKEFKIEIFKKFVSIVNLELSTYCNRKCSYCPMSMYPRRQQYMTDALFKKIISELRQINYNGRICLNWFNEPLLDERLTEKISYIRKKLPNVFILFNSNGDFLTQDFLTELFDAGLNLIIVTLHTVPGKKYVDEEKRFELKNFLQKINLSHLFKKRSEIPGKNITVTENLTEENQILILCNNWQIYGNDRGGTLKNIPKEIRTYPCLYPFREIFIKYDGTVTPCCNIYFDSDPVYGNLNETDLIDIYFSREIIDFRKNLFDFSPKNSRCRFCNAPDNANIETARQRDEILEQLKA